MKNYTKPALQVREIRVEENLAAKLDLRDKNVWTKYNMLRANNTNSGKMQDLIAK